MREDKCVWAPGPVPGSIWKIVSVCVMDGWVDGWTGGWMGRTFGLGLSVCSTHLETPLSLL